MQSVYLLSVVMNQLILRSVHTVRQNHILQELEDSTEDSSAYPQLDVLRSVETILVPKRTIILIT